MMPVHIRWMLRRDLGEVLVIEHATFEDAWSEEEFHRVRRQRNGIGMVAEAYESIVGFMIYELLRSEIHLLNFAVHPDCCRRGIGRQLAAKLVETLYADNVLAKREKVTLALRESNLGAQLFFKACGFKAATVEREHFRDTGEDAYVMEYRKRAPVVVQAGLGVWR